MRLETFDVFDTVLVRCVETPEEVFRLVARKLRWPAFAAERIAAERRARRSLPHGEPTLEEICQHLRGLPTGLTLGDVASAEIGVERRVWRPVDAVRPLVRRAREAGARIGFLSDMYLPSSILAGWLVEQGIAEPGDPLWVSCELRCSKHAGTAYDEVRRRVGSVDAWVHWGDNPRADVERALSAGVEGRLWRTADWSAPERRWSKLAVGTGACVRAARLSSADPAAGPVTGPAVVLTAFVRDALAGAGQAGVNRLHFLARDGQVLARIAEVISRRGPAVDVRYVYASRRVWRLAAYGADGTGLEDVVALALDARELPEFLLAAGDSVEPPACWDAVPRWLEMHRTSIRNHAREVAEGTRRYLEEAGLLDPGPIALVDLGWSGTLQRCLERLRRAWGSGGSVSGWYLGFFAQPRAGTHAFLHALGRPESRLVHSASAWEMLCSADHGTLLGHRPDGAPTLAPVAATSAARIRLLQDAIVRVAGNLVDAECPLPDGETCRRWSRTWLATPDPGELELLRGGYTTRALASGQCGPAKVRPRRLARLLLTRHRHLEEWPWPGAVLSASLPGWPPWSRRLLLGLREAAWDHAAQPRQEISQLNRPGQSDERPV